MIIYRCYKNVSMPATDQFRGYSAKCCIGFRRVTGCQRRLAGQLGQPSRGSIHLHNSYRQTYPGWWFGNVWNIFDIPYIGNVIVPTDFHSIIFQRDGQKPTKQYQCQGVDGKIQCVLELERLVGIRYFWPPMEAGVGDGIHPHAFEEYRGSFHGYVSHNQRVYIII